LEEAAVRGAIPLIPPAQVLSHLPTHLLDAKTARRWCQGQAIALLPPLAHEFVRVYDNAPQFLGVGQVEAGRLLPKVVLSPVG
jgi:tRNA pseudouridine55 synthase